jgi:uncharacterized membrane protein
MNRYLVTGIVVLAALIAVAITLAGRARRAAIRNEEMPGDELAEFRRMRDAGKISEEEFRRMKKIVAGKTVQRVKGE